MDSWLPPQEREFQMGRNSDKHTHTHTHTTSHRDAAHSLKYWLRLREWPPTPVFLPGELHEQRSLADYSPQAPKKLETEGLTLKG